MSPWTNRATSLAAPIVLIPVLVTLLWLPAMAVPPVSSTKTTPVSTLESLQPEKQLAPSAIEQRLWKAVSAVNDPELDIGIVDLGLVRRIVVNETPKVDEPHVILTMVLTSPLCPYAKDLLRGIRDAIKGEMPDSRLKVVIDGKTRWTPALMSEEGKRRFAGEG